MTTVLSQLEKLKWQFESNQKTIAKLDDEILDIQSFLSVADRTTAALETLSQSLFEEVLGVLEDKLTIAIQEVLGQPIKFKSKPDFKRGAAAVSFSIDREGNEEDVLRGQGGSVQNVLSVGLRMFALATLDEDLHRRFLVLDEQDCWLRPELVPSLVNIVHRAAKELEFQVLMISHHDVGLFDRYADRIYRLTPTKDSVEAAVVESMPNVVDSN